MGEGAGKSSEAESLPSGRAVAASSRPIIFISHASMHADGIVHAIDESSMLVLVLSEHAIASAHVGREIERAVSKWRPVIALRIDSAPLTAAFEYCLNQSQWIEGGGGDSAIAQLVGAVGQRLGVSIRNQKIVILGITHDYKYGCAAGAAT